MSDKKTVNDKLSEALDVEYTIKDTSETSIDVASATNLGEAGTIRVDSEDIAYTGKSTNTLTGCTRGDYNTTPKSHTANTDVFQASEILETDVAYYQVKHNLTSITRASFDFRIIPKSRYIESNHLTINTKIPFGIGGYYEVL